jgi:hypothetical protein
MRNKGKIVRGHIQSGIQPRKKYLGFHTPLFTILNKKHSIIPNHLTTNTFHLPLTTTTKEIKADAISVGLDEFR